MGWASSYIQQLKEGHTVQFRPRGNSMQGRIESGQLCTVAPALLEELQVGDVVLCRVRGKEYLHLIKAIRDGQFQIGNNHGGINGWVTGRSIFGRVTSITS